MIQINGAQALIGRGRKAFQSVVNQKAIVGSTVAIGLRTDGRLGTTSGGCHATTSRGRVFLAAVMLGNRIGRGRRVGRCMTIRM